MMITKTTTALLAVALRRVVLFTATLLVSSPALIAGWTPLANAPPNGVALMLLLSDGTVMAQRAPYVDATKATILTNTWYRLTPVNGSYVNGTWTTLSAMLNSRLWYSSVVLRDGRVLVAGGEYGTGGSAAEIYDPVHDQWTTIPAPGALSDSVAKILRDGRVLVGPASGGITLIYNPSTNAWSPGPTPQASANLNEVTWLKLPDDSFLTVPTNSQISQRFLQTTNQWIVDGNVGVNLYSSVGSEIGAAFYLSTNGKALFLGGDSTTALYTPSGNDNPGTWVQGPSIPNVPNASGTLVPAGAPDAGAAMMVNGRILCAFSPQMFTNPSPPPPNTFPNPTSFAVYDPVANSFAPINGPTGATVNGPSFQNLMLALPDGTVLYSNFTNQLYTYSPDTAPAPLAAGKPTISSIVANADGSYHLTGTKLNGISEGAAYGDDAQMDSNYPLVRLTDSGGNVRYGRTFNWSSTGVSTGNTLVTTEFTIPDVDLYGGGAGPGIYYLEVVANGISSDSILIGGPIWVDFNYGGVERGTFAAPYRTLHAALDAALFFPVTGRTIHIKGGSSPETFTAPPISIPVTITSTGGPATVGQ